MSINFVRTLPSPEEIKEEFPLSKEAVEFTLARKAAKEREYARTANRHR